MALDRWMTYEGVDIFRIDGSAYTYKTSHVALDADGCPRAYHPDNTGLDHNANAGFPNGGWRNVLVVDPDHPNRPFVQPDGPTKGFFVSKTTLVDSVLADTDPAKYVDSETFPYIVFPGNFFELDGTGNWGDVLMARSLVADHQSAAIVADRGPRSAPLGEMSLKLAVALGGHNPNPRNGAGAPRGPLQYVVFPRSRRDPRWRRSLQDVQEQAATLLDQIGGWPTI